MQNDRNDPVGSATVLLIPESRLRQQSFMFRSVTTDKSGHFSIRGIVPGDYKLIAWEDVEQGAWEDPDFLSIYEDRAKKLSLQAGGRESRTVTVIPAAVE